MISKYFYNTFFQTIRENKKICKKTYVVLSVKFFEVFLHHFFGGGFNLIKVKLKRSRPTDLKTLKYISLAEFFCELYEEVVIPFFNIYCFLGNIDFTGDTIHTFLKNLKKREYFNPIIWFLKSPYKVFAVTIRNILYKNFYAKEI